MVNILRKPGFILNPRDGAVNSIFRMIEANNGQCPCDNPDKGTPDAICPCRMYREENHCCCHLYIPDPKNKQ